MNLDFIDNGIVLNHIQAGRAMQIVAALKLHELDSTVAILKNVKSTRMGRKDLIKIDEMIDFDVDALGFIDPGITVTIIKNGKIAEKKYLTPPQTLTNIIRCKNPRCITSSEQEINQLFSLAQPEPPVYRCQYCQAAYTNGK